ncbi:GNAT family N-acetyltransferase [Epilithonimonas ginsengisoli]|uniref:GNAT family N-acetyltransferase n=1 Tax=Epilithonimonas ginsengisoli TaxID=1245592 RepID=A0ABU4JMX6_9FLAO|nr:MULTISPECIES: GNAT family N-acetyltransferase [Chryseobacterium group]MBV6881981.1 GNAT family N-acetyltransferase [Epilithonimonas sp. FP105]MDW8551074.1 GNAT family N-acetyltransferase [Epilithonimonas ginsengisoli]OAH68551.1 GNAT family acetyltransferase [Chryseobacterium sp. FP211-J200]
MKILRTTSENLDFQKLVKQLDAYLAVMDGEEHGFYDQYNKIDSLKNCIVIFDNDEAVTCGAIKEFDKQSMEVKRMFTLPEKRGKGLASAILNELESWTKELGYEKTILETGKRQTEAVALYQKCNYKVIPNYGQYAGVENSVCFEKDL